MEVIDPSEHDASQEIFTILLPAKSIFVLDHDKNARSYFKKFSEFYDVHASINKNIESAEKSITGKGFDSFEKFFINPFIKKDPLEACYWIAKHVPEKIKNDLEIITFYADSKSENPDKIKNWIEHQENNEIYKFLHLKKYSMSYILKSHILK